MITAWICRWQLSPWQRIERWYRKLQTARTRLMNSTFRGTQSRKDTSWVRSSMVTYAHKLSAVWSLPKSAVTLWDFFSCQSKQNLIEFYLKAFRNRRRSDSIINAFYASGRQHEYLCFDRGSRRWRSFWGDDVKLGGLRMSLMFIHILGCNLLESLWDVVKMGATVWGKIMRNEELEKQLICSKLKTINSKIS